MIYGAAGYTGRLTAERAVDLGLTPILAGRSASEVEALGARLGLPVRVFGLDDAPAVDRGLEGVGLVLSCAGPFSRTARPMVDGCLRARAHYLDITGEVAVFEEQFARDAELRAGGVVAISGVGFDVVPTDCIAARLKELVPDARELVLAFGGFARTSRGTATTMVEGLPAGGLVRRDGRLTPMGFGELVADIDFADRRRHCMAIPWGDVSTAYRTTSIPDITVFSAASAGMVRAARLGGRLAWLLGRPAVQRFLKRQVARRVTGPTAEERSTGRVQLYGRAVGPSGAVTLLGQCPEGYRLTVESSLACVRRLLDRPGAVAAGAHTPALAFGAGLFESLPGCSLARSPA